MKGHWFAFIVQIFLAMWFLIVAKVVWTFPIYIVMAYWILLGIIEETVKKKQMINKNELIN